MSDITIQNFEAELIQASSLQPEPQEVGWG